MELRFIHGLGILVGFFGLAWVVAGVVLAIILELEWTWHGPVASDWMSGESVVGLFNIGLWIVILGAAIFGVGSAVSEVARRKKEKGLIPAPKPPN